MAIPLPGLATGLDTSTLIQQLLAVERRPVTSLETRKLKFQVQSTAFQDLNTRLGTLKTRAEVLKDPATFFSRSVTSSAETVATATAAPGTTKGTFTLTATALAKGSIAAAATTKANLTDVVASATGNFEFKLGATGTVVSVAVDATTTLEQLVKGINDKNAGVKATAINAGTSATPAWKLTIISTATGAANNIVIVTDATTLSVTNTQAAADAAFSVTGLGSFTRANNTFADVIDGVTITLKAASGSTDLALDYDKSATQARMQTLLDAYNDVVRAIDGQSKAIKGADGKLTSGIFSGDVVPRQIRSALASKIATSVAGTYKTLAEIGITTGKDGTLSLDGAKFQKALNDNAPAVSTLVAGTATKDGIADLLWAATDTATKAVTGTIAARQDGITTSIKNIQKQIDSALLRLSTVEKSLQARFVNLEKTVNQIQATGNSLLSQLAGLEKSTSK